MRIHVRKMLFEAMAENNSTVIISSHNLTEIEEPVSYTHLNPSVKRPLRQLVAFARERIEGGSKRHFKFDIKKSELRFYDVSRCLLYTSKCRSNDNRNALGNQ